MSKAPRVHPTVAVVGTLALVVAAVAMLPALLGAHGDFTVLPRVDGATRLGAVARALDPAFHTVSHGAAYDGQFYWGIAVDPLGTGPVHAVLDKPSYRYGHPFYSWLAWLVSGGDARGAAVALTAIALVSLLVAAASVAWLGRLRGGSGWEGLFVALNPGLVTAAVHDLAEPLAAALLAVSLVSYVTRRRAAAWLGLACLPLAKEPLLLVVLAIVISEVVQRRRRDAVIFGAAALPAAAWWLVAHLRFGAWFTTGGTALAAPFAGWSHTLSGSDTHLGRHAALAAGVLVVLLAVFVAAAGRALVRRGPVDFSYLALAAVAACLAPNATSAFTTGLRNTALLLMLVPFVVAGQRLVPRRADGGSEPVASGHA